MSQRPAQPATDGRLLAVRNVSPLSTGCEQCAWRKAYTSAAAGSGLAFVPKLGTTLTEPALQHLILSDFLGHLPTHQRIRMLLSASAARLRWASITI
jgi:hypothetical protein